MGKFVFLKGLGLPPKSSRETEKSRVGSPGLSLTSSISSIADGMKLIGQANVLDWRGYLMFRGVTDFWVARKSTNRSSANCRLGASAPFALAFFRGLGRIQVAR